MVLFRNIVEKNFFYGVDIIYFNMYVLLRPKSSLFEIFGRLGGINSLKIDMMINKYIRTNNKHSHCYDTIIESFEYVNNEVTYL